MASSLHRFIMFVHLIFYYCFHLITATPNTFSSLHPLCHAEDSHALLQFKQTLFFNKSASSDTLAYWKLESWKLQGGARDCGSWDGVEFEKYTGHAIGLDPSSNYIFGSINSNSSLFSLVHLRRLNLADNHFNYSQIPSIISHLLELKNS